MSFLSRTNGFRFHKAANLTPRQRYINLDGSLYGSRHVLRVLTMPSVKMGALISVFLAAGAALVSSESKRRGIFVEN
ncbi:MAG TPA: hypothetical protein VMV79_08750, partial [Alphaproteobacteria bacterium]|nr:hypothetical protein [Alphaproteobacteria bacterium]